MIREKGITIMTLVITIIILLILAAVTINLTIGENGIITKAKQAGENYIQAEYNELSMLNELDSKYGTSHVSTTKPSDDNSNTENSSNNNSEPQIMYNSNIRYNEETDMVQIYYNEQWYDWESPHLFFDGNLYVRGAYNKNYFDPSKYDKTGGSYSIESSYIEYAYTRTALGAASNVYMTFSKPLPKGFNTLKITYTAPTTAGNYGYAACDVYILKDGKEEISKQAYGYGDNNNGSQNISTTFSGEVVMNIEPYKDSDLYLKLHIGLINIASSSFRIQSIILQ